MQSMSSLTPLCQPLPGSLIRPKAVEFANKLGNELFTVNKDCLSRSKKEKKLLGKSSDDATSANTRGTENWIREFGQSGNGS